MNDKYYLCESNKGNSTLDNGINIYINKKWNNILININIADNTYKDVSEKDRDYLYNELYKKITAFNFTNAINDISNKFGFSDHINYIIIDENNVINKYSSNNIKDMPYLIKCEGPDRLDVKVNSIIKIPIQLPNSLNSYNKLESGKIINMSYINYYNNLPVAANIVDNIDEPKVIENYHGIKNITYNTIYRYSGYYMPLFYDIELFSKDNEFKQSANCRFDTNLSNFGIMRERKISKVNRKGSILRLKDIGDERSIYPMLDEFGYSTYDFFIFSSTWDLKYYLEIDKSTLDKNYLKRKV
jgi:hypothetical protein